jgi:putative ABC transport system permease protein
VRLFFQLSGVALRSLWANKMRSALTMLGVIIGVGAVIVMLGIGEGAKRQVSKRITSMGTNLLVVRPGFGRRRHVRSASVQTLTLKDAEAIKREVPDIAAVAPEAGKNAQIKYFAKNTNTTILGSTEAYLSVNNFTLAEGRFIEPQDVRRRSKVVVIGATPAKELFEGDEAVGKRIKIKGINFEVIGLLEAKGQSGYRDPDAIVVVPVTTAMYRLFGIKHLRAINVQVAKQKAMSNAQADIEDLLMRRHRIPEGGQPDFNIRNQAEILKTMNQVTETFTTLLAAVAFVSMLVGGIGIMNIMLVSVTERTREIGIRKAVGARQRHILFQFLVEAVVLSVLGGLLGIAAGLFAAHMVGESGSWVTAVRSDSIIFAFSIAAGTGVFFGLYPAYKASRLDPIEALRYE